MPPSDRNHDHGHGHGLGLARAGERHRGRLIAAFAVIAVFFVVEVVAAFATNSLALLSDAGHMLTVELLINLTASPARIESVFGDGPAAVKETVCNFGAYATVGVGVTDV